MTCRITVADGITSVVMENIPGLGVSYAAISGGGAILRFLDGSAAKQQRWHKEQYTVTGNGKVPSGLRDIDFSRVLTLTVETGLGVNVYTPCYSLGVNETWNLTGAAANWNMVIEHG